MRLWSLHPKYLDPQGLVAAWREGLLARAVLRGETRGYTRHPQLERFREHASPKLAINAYLAGLHDEARTRGYAFDRSKIGAIRSIDSIDVTTGQLDFERQHLMAKLAARSPALFERFRALIKPACHPSFRVFEGPAASWERGRTPVAIEGAR